MIWRHPSKKRLLRWSESGRPRMTERHLLGCSLCEARLEELTRLDQEVVVDLKVALGAPADFNQRMSQRLREEVQDRETLMVMADLLGLGVETSRLLIEEGDEDG